MFLLFLSFGSVCGLSGSWGADREPNSKRTPTYICGVPETLTGLKSRFRYQTVIKLT